MKAHYRWYVAIVMFLFLLLHQADKLLIGPLTTAIMADFGINEAQMGAVSSLAIVVGFIVPRIVDGASPVAVSLLGVGGILILAIYFVHGVSWSTTAALIGTFVAAGLTMVLGLVFSDLAHLTGYGSEDAAMIAATAKKIGLGRKPKAS